MRQELLVALFAGMLALGLGGAATVSVSSSACDPSSSGMNGKVKPSSLAPGERSYNNAYGAPIAKPIVSKHPHQKAKPKAQPQLHSSPRPAG